MLSNEEKFWKARDEFYEPDDEEDEECTSCDGIGSSPDVDALTSELIDVKCKPCEGTGRVPVQKKSRGFGMYV